MSSGRLCNAPRPDAGNLRCRLRFPHPDQGHEDWEGNTFESTVHGDPGHIVDVALGFEGQTLVDRVAISLMVAFGRAEPEHGVSRHPASYVTTFADMARAVTAQFNVTDRVPPVIDAVNGCQMCGKEQRGHAIEQLPDGTFHTWVEPTDDQRKDRLRARRRANEKRIAHA